MEHIIKYFYDFDVVNLKKDNTAYSFEWDNNLYYFVMFERKESDLKEIIKIINDFKLLKFACHDIIFNKFRQVVTNYNNKKYVMLKVFGRINSEISIFDMVDINNKLHSLSIENDNYKNNWKSLWETKINYFEKQLRNYCKNKNGILNTFSYYIGLAENAIEYVSRVEKNYSIGMYDYVSVSHRRIFWPNYSLNYLNPLSFLIDLEVRDYAEYFKNAFFENIDIRKEFISFLKIVNLGEYSYHMFFARFLFPTYYFDVFEKLIDEELCEEKLINIVNKSQKYEEFLCFVFNEINKRSKLISIPWLITKKL